MANIKQIKSEALATIDAAMSILNRFPDLNNSNTELSYNTSTNPFTFLMDLFKTTTGYNKLISILAKFISYELPILEAAVKGILIAKLKDIISCSVNPFFTEDILKNGIVFNVEEIDIADVLKYSPYDKVGKYFYFDTEPTINEGETDFAMTDDGSFIEAPKPKKVQNPSDLIKSDDMDALIWFMINKANKRYVWKPKKYRKGDEYRPDYPFEENSQPSQEDIREHYDIPLSELNEAHDSNEITDEEYNKQKERLDKIIENYRKNYNKLKKEDGIITFEYYEHSQNLRDAYGEAYKLQTPYNNCLHVFIGDVREKKTNLINQLEDKEGDIYDNERNITLFSNKIENKNFKIQQIREDKLLLEEDFSKGDIDEDEYKKQLKKLNNKEKILQNDINDLLKRREQIYAAKRRLQFEIGTIKTQLEKTRDQFFPFLNSDKNRNYYYGKTLIEFNIDYIMSLKLFDEKSLAARLLDSLTACLTIDLNFSYKRLLIKNEIKKMVNMITESDDLVVSDCFFTFSNDDYDAMSRQAELRKAGLLTINGDETSAVKINAEDILNSLNQINEDSNKQTIQTIIEGTITNLSKELTDTSYLSTDKVNFGIQMNFIENLLDSLAYVIVCSVLSPKVYLLLLINLKIIGRETNFDLECFIGQYKQLIADLIRSIRDQLLDYLMREIMIIIGDLVKEITIKLSVEQARYYARLIKRLIGCFRKHGRSFDFNVDNVDYADIYEEQEEPKNNEC